MGGGKEEKGAFSFSEVWGWDPCGHIPHRGRAIVGVACRLVLVVMARR